MPRPSSVLLLLIFFSLANPNPNPRFASASEDNFSILNYRDYDYSPPPPLPPPPPAGPTVGCEEDLGGSGSFDTICELQSSVNLSNNVLIKGNGSLYILDGVVLSCPVAGCLIIARLAGEFKIGKNAVVEAGTVQVAAANVSVSEGAVLNTTALGGDPPEQTSGVGTGTHGDGGGHGGRGASCFVKDGDTQEDSWGGDVYAWNSLTMPVSYGSRGGTTSLENEYGGGGGGRVMLEVEDVLEVDGVISADGGDGGLLGGGGSGGSIYIKANKM